MPANLDKIQTTLPRSLEDVLTVAVMIKHILDYKNTYLSGNVRPNIDMVAMKDKCKTEGITMNSD